MWAELGNSCIYNANTKPQSYSELIQHHSCSLLDLRQRDPWTLLFFAYGAGVPLAATDLQIVHLKIFSKIMLLDAVLSIKGTNIFSSDSSFTERGIKAKEPISHFTAYPV